MMVKRFLSFILITIIMCFYMNINVTQAQNENYVQNPSFENGLTNWDYVQSSNNPLTIKESGVHTGNKALSYWSDSNFTFTVSQTIYNLPKGRYKISVWTMGDNSQNILKLYVKNYGGEEIIKDITDIGWNNWQQWSIEFNVSTNSCTIGIICTANAGNWGYIDDFELIKLPSSGQIKSIKDVNITAAKCNVIELPKTVDVVYDDDSEGKVFCDWEEIDYSKLCIEGTGFSVYGTVYGTDIKAIANINVQPIKEIKPITPLNIIVNDKPELPQKVYVICYNNDDVLVNVYWQDINQNMITNAGSYTVEGSIYGTEQKAKAIINVQYKSMDFNNDSVVNVGDLAIAAAYLSKTKTDSDWDKAQIADINNDGKIDIEDLKLIVKKIKGRV